MIKIELKDYTPIGHQVLVKLIVKDNITAAGIHTGDQKKVDKWMEVAKVGNLVSAVEPGQMILMNRPTQGMVQLEFNGDPYLQCSEHDIAGKAPKPSGIILDGNTKKSEILA